MTDINEKWDLEIKPKGNLIDLKLKEVWFYRDLMWLFVRRDFVAQYKQTILGPLWNFVQPLLTTVMFLLVFGKIAKIPTDGIPPTLFYLSGITLWTYFSTCLNATSTTFTANAGIFGKVYFPRLVLPISIVLSNIVRFGIQFSLLIVAMIWFNFHGYPVSVNVNWFYIPLLVILMAGLGLGGGIIISSLTTKYRDFVVLLGFIIQLMMYVTPIIYPLSFLNNSKYKVFINLNPLTSVVELFRYSLFGKGTFNLNGILYSSIFMIITLFIGTVIFNKVEKSFMDTV